MKMTSQVYHKIDRSPITKHQVIPKSNFPMVNAFCLKKHTSFKKQFEIRYHPKAVRLGDCWQKIPFNYQKSYQYILKTVLFLHFYNTLSLMFENLVYATFINKLT
jgi:hypothetical protein